MSSGTPVSEWPAHKTTEKDSTPRSPREQIQKDWTNQQRTDYSAEIAKWRRTYKSLSSKEAAEKLNAIFNRYPITKIERAVFLQKHFTRFNDEDLKRETERIAKSVGLRKDD